MTATHVRWPIAALWCAALIVALCACGARTTATTDGSSAADSRAADQRAPADATGDSATPGDAAPPDGPAADAPRPSGFTQYLLWQAPGGYAGRGPALELLSDGTLRLWQQTPQLTPHKTSGWTYQTKLSAADSGKIFGLLRGTNYNGLPHATRPAGECYPQLYYDPCVAQACALSVVKIDYAWPDDLSPELDAVYKGLQGMLSASYPSIAPPSQYCLFFL